MRIVLRPSCNRLVILVSIALVVRIGMLLSVWSNPQRMLWPDSYTYLQAAQNLLAGHGFSTQAESPYRATAFITPAYPVFISILYSLLGRHLQVIAIAQVLLSVGTVCLVYWLGSRLFSPGMAFWGALLLALSLGSIVYAVIVLTETLFTFLFLWAVSSLAFYRYDRKWIWLASAGFPSGLAMLCRPIAVFYPLVGLCVLGVIHWKEWKRLMVVSFIFLIAMLVPILPWIARNQRLLGTPVISTISNYNLYLFDAAALEADVRGISLAEAQAEMRTSVTALLNRSGLADDEASRGKYYGQLVREIILAHPLRFGFLHLKRDLYSLLPNTTDFLRVLGIVEGVRGTLNVISQRGFLAAVRHYIGGRIWLLGLLIPVAALTGLVYLTCLIGVIGLFKKRDLFTLSLLFLPALLLLLIPGAASDPRFSVPAMPLLCLIAGMGIEAVCNWGTQRFRLRPSS